MSSRAAISEFGPSSRSASPKLLVNTFRLNILASWKLEIGLKLIGKLGATERPWSGGEYRGLGGNPGGDDGLAGLAGLLAGGGERRGEGLGGDSRVGDGAPDEEQAARSPRRSAAV